MGNYYEQWLTYGMNWMREYRRKLLRSAIFAALGLIVCAALFGVGMSASKGYRGEELLSAAGLGAVLGFLMFCFYFVILSIGTRPGRVKRSINRGVKRMGITEAEKELLGRELLEAANTPSCVFNYAISSPKIKQTPARFILSPNYACLIGSVPLVHFIRLSDVEKIRASEDSETEVVRNSSSTTTHYLTIYTIKFYYKDIDGTKTSNSADETLSFYTEGLRDTVLSMLENQSLSNEFA